MKIPYAESAGFCLAEKKSISIRFFFYLQVFFEEI